MEIPKTMVDAYVFYVPTRKYEPNNIAVGHFCNALERKATFFIRLNVISFFTKCNRNNLPGL
jgi:hypothetical protein